MRDEREMLACILDTARRDERVRAVLLNGSRANPHVEKDPWRDYDVVYVVTETEPFIRQPGWLSAFGELAVSQEPDALDAALGEDMDFSRSYTWLMLYRDGNRIDLTIWRRDKALEEYDRDSLTEVLLDKDGALSALPPADDRSYHIRKPTAAEFLHCTNEFWWCTNNTAKGLRRGQLPYVMWMLYDIVHPQLVRMCEWTIGARHDFAVSSGAHGKYFEKYLPPEIFTRFLATYAPAETERLWDALFEMCALFGELGRGIADKLGFEYRADWERGALGYLRAMRDGEL